MYLNLKKNVRNFKIISNFTFLVNQVLFNIGNLAAIPVCTTRGHKNTEGVSTKNIKTQDIKTFSFENKHSKRAGLSDITHDFPAFFCTEAF